MFLPVRRFCVLTIDTISRKGLALSKKSTYGNSAHEELGIATWKSHVCPCCLRL